MDDPVAPAPNGAAPSGSAPSGSAPNGATSNGPARRAAPARRATLTRSAYVLYGLSLVAFAAFGAGLVPILDIFREMALLPPGRWNAEPTIAGIALLFIGAFVGGPLVLAAMWRSNDWLSEIQLGPGTAVLGTGLGTVAAAGGWSVLEPDRDAAAAAPLAVAAPWALPLVLIGLGALLLLGAQRRIAARARRQARRAELRRTGRVVRGRILERRFLRTWVASQPLFLVTVEYDGPHGRVQARRRLLCPPLTAPAVGQPILVVHDPGDPADLELEFAADAPPEPAPWVAPDL